MIQGKKLIKHSTPKLSQKRMDYSKKTVAELKELCKEKDLKGYSKKKKDELIKLLEGITDVIEHVEDEEDSEVEEDIHKMNITKLRALCKEHSIKGTSGKKKDDLIKILSDYFEKTKTVITHVGPAVKITKELPDKLRMIDLFAGTGAFSYAFQQTNNVNVVFANDMIEHSKKMYDLNFDHILTLKDLNIVSNESIPEHDILTGGFPCQPFSIAGKQEGFEDKRSNVFWKILSIIDHHNPGFVILENVKNLLSHDDNKTFETIKKNLEDRGYNLKYKVLNTAEITGIPQHRERIYIVGIKEKEIYDKFTLDFPKIEKRKIDEFLETDEIPNKYYYTSGSAFKLLEPAVKKKNTIYQYRRVYVRENKSSECPTLTANMGSGGHNVPIVLDEKGIRKLTPRECFNFQGFPTTYKLPDLSDCHLYKLAGNAVSVPVVKLIADRLISLV